MPSDHPLGDKQRVHRHSPVIGPDGKRAGAPSHRQAETSHRQAEQPAAAPITIRGDWPALAASITASADPAQALAELVRSTVERAADPVRQGVVSSLMPYVARAVADARAEGFKAGKREGLAAGSVELRPSAELLTALRQPAPVVNVSPAAVAVKNEVVVPARAVVARPQADGSVLMEPQE